MSSNLLNPYRHSFYLIQLVIWTLYWLATRIVWLAYTAPPWQYNLVEKLLGLVFTIGLAFIFWHWRNWKFPTQILAGLFMTGLFGVALRISYNIIDLHFIQLTLPVHMSFARYFWHASTAILLLLPWSTGYFLVTYYSKYLLQRDLAQQAALQAKEAQLKLLHLQISPHFLFNVLNSLDTLLLKEDINKSRIMLKKLSTFLRQTLSEDLAHTMPLKNEIERARTYVEIEKVRFSDKLTVQWHIDPSLEDFMVPSLILQPLIENAIKHSVGLSLHGGHITISATNEGGQVALSIRNKANGDTSNGVNNEEGLGIGLENTIARLKVTYGDLAHLSSQKNADGSFEVRILIGEQKAVG